MLSPKLVSKRGQTKNEEREGAERTKNERGRWSDTRSPDRERKKTRPSESASTHVFFFLFDAERAIVLRAKEQETR